MNETDMFNTCTNTPVADPGFPRGGGANSPEGGGRQHEIFPKFPKKLKEFEPPGGRASLTPPLDPPLHPAVL